MKILKDSSFYVLGEVLSKMVAFILLPYVSRKMGVANYGELSYFSTYSAIFGFLLLLSQDGAISRYFYFYGKRSLNLILFAGYAYTLTVGIIMLLICWWFKSEIMAYLVISAIVSSFIAVQFSVRQCRRQAKTYFIIQMIGLLISTVSTIITLEVYETDLVEKRIIAILISNIFILIISSLWHFNNNKIKFFKLEKYKLGLFYVLGFGLPLVLHHISNLLKGQLDRIFIYHLFNEVELGLYAMGANIALLINMLILAVNKASIPYYFEAMKNNKISIKWIHQKALYAFLISPIPSLVLIFFIPDVVFQWILGDEFFGVKYFVEVFAFSYMLTIPYLLLVNYLFYYGKNSTISLLSILSTLFYLLFLFIFSWLGRMDYIPFSSVFSSLVLLVVLYFATLKVSIEREKL